MEKQSTGESADAEKLCVSTPETFLNMLETFFKWSKDLNPTQIVSAMFDMIDDKEENQPSPNFPGEKL